MNRIESLIVGGAQAGLIDILRNDSLRPPSWLPPDSNDVYSLARERIVRLNCAAWLGVRCLSKDQRREVSEAVKQLERKGLIARLDPLGAGRTTHIQVDVDAVWQYLNKDSKKGSNNAQQ